MVEGDIKRYYDEKSEAKLNGFVKGNARVDLAWNSIKNIPINPKSILEIGCGIGEMSWKMSLFWPNAHVLGWDISTKSVDIAKKLFRNSNLEYIYTDKIENLIPLNGRKYDLIVLVDVYEHIPPVQKLIFNNFIKNHLSDNGYLFFSCPTPRHLDWLKLHDPKEIQPVDESIYIHNLTELAENIGRSLFYYKEISVWHHGDYFHCLFSKYSSWEKYSEYRKTDNEINLLGFLRVVYRYFFPIAFEYEPNLNKRRKMVLASKLDLQ